MKHIILILLCLNSVVALAEIEDVDTVSPDTLKEVVVEAELQRTTAKVTTYTPTARTKKAAQNATDLLQQMAIPQLTVDPISKVVTTSSGQDVSIFVNYLRASTEDMQGLKTTDVLRVEYMDFPTDPRFQGVPHVVNIIVQEYEYGGYTKISDNQFAIIGVINKGSIYSKFAYRKMVYDLYAGCDYVNSHEMGTSEYSTFRLPFGEINRNQEYLSSNIEYIKVPLTFRASYNTKNVQIINTVGFSVNNRFENNQRGQLSFEPSNGVVYKYKNDSPSINRTLSWRGNYFISLPKLWSVVFNPRFTYGNNTLYSKYSTDLPNVDPIVNDAKEDVYNFRASAYLMKRINKRNTVKLGMLGGSSINNVSYLGTSPYDTDFSNSFCGAEIAYTLNMQDFSVDADAGILGEFLRTNGIKYNDRYPYAHLSASWSPNKRNRLNLWAQYATNSPDVSERSPNVIQNNELLYQTGNPLLQNSRHVTFNGSYTFLPNNKFSLTTFATYFGIYDRAVTIYDLYNECSSIIRTYQNSGDFTKVQVGANATLRMLENNLIFQIRPSLTHFSSIGYVESKYTPLSCSIYGQYYLGDFRFSAYYATRNHVMNQSTGGYNTSRSSYQIQMGWANGVWNIGLSVNNFLRYGYDGSWGELNTPLCSKRVITHSANYHAYMMLSAIYTFGYGKKINRKNEIDAIDGAGSAIMK